LVVIESAAPDIGSVAGECPRHVAIIMDGNNRWAKQRGLPGTEGHRAGEEAVRRLVEYAARCKLDVLTLFAFFKRKLASP
jgi:undecaprenyl diphosphate synthase